MGARTVRRVAVVMHRWTGLALAAFLVVVATTGAVLPFRTDLQKLFAPERFLAEVPTQPIDWLALRDIAELRSGGLVDTMPLHLDDGAAPSFDIAAPPGRPGLGFDELVLDPLSGQEIARGRSGDLRDGPAQIVPFLDRVHESLALGDLGSLLVGLVALAWTVDCFVGFYLTLPMMPEGWWRRWRGAWTVRWPVPSAFRLQFDLHRAGGLWFWALMFVFAWSGLGFNLPAVYGPVMHVLTGYEAAADAPSAVPPHLPALGWPEGLAAARSRATEAAAALGFQIVRERELRFQRGANRYALGLRTDRDRSDSAANSWVTIDADTGALVSVELPTGMRAGNTIDTWLGMIHEASVGGLAMRLLVSLSGLAIVAVTVTGVLIWMRKRKPKASRRSQAERRHPARTPLL